jgi:erythromycin esterase-like protein
MVRLAFKALVDDIRPHRGRPNTGQARLGLAAQGKKGFGQRLIPSAGRPTATAGDHAGRGHGQQQMDTCRPAQAVAPAHSGQPRQPARATALGIPGRAPGAVEGFLVHNQATFLGMTRCASCSQPS